MDAGEFDEYLKEEQKRLEKEKARLGLRKVESIDDNRDEGYTESQNVEVNAPELSNLRKPDYDMNIHYDTRLVTSQNNNYHSPQTFNEKCPAADLLNRRMKALSASNSPRNLPENLNVGQCRQIRPQSEVPKASADFSTSSNEEEPGTSKSAKERSNSNVRARNPQSPFLVRQDDMMEEWVTDTFYSYFPSFNVLYQKRQNLAKDRQREYQEYLKKSTEEKRTNRHVLKSNKVSPLPEVYQMTNQSNTESNPPENINHSDDQNQSTPTGTKLKLLQDLKHTSLSALINSNEVSERNKEISESEKKKKFEYQQQLLKQIDEKRKEVEELKRREKLEEELLAKKIEEQIKTMQLEDELEKEKVKAEKIRISIEQNQAMQKKLLQKLNSDEKLLEQHISKTPVQDNKVYKYFSNSSRAHDYDKYSHESFFEISDSESDEFPRSNSTALQVNGRCKSCNKGMKTSKCLNHGNSITNSNEQNNLHACHNCQKPFPSLSNKEPNTHCLFCHSQRNICVDCMRNVCTYCGEVTYSPIPMTSRSLPVESGRLSQTSSNKSFKVLYSSFENVDHEDRKENNPHVWKETEKSFNASSPAYSIFSPETKIIEPKLNISARESPQKRQTKAEISTRLSKYLKNYGDLSDRLPSFSYNMTNNISKSKSNLSSMPLLREPSKKIVSKIREEPVNKSASTKNIKILSQKWEIPAVQKNVVSSSSGVLTQLGAFKKQLQIDKLDLDQPSNGT